MSSSDIWEQESYEEWRRWMTTRAAREDLERVLRPDQRLDEVGWHLFHLFTNRGIDPDEAARRALEDPYRLRLKIRDDQARTAGRIMRARYAELHPGAAAVGVWDTQAPEQLAFWKNRLNAPEYVYFIQSGENGPIKIGLSNRPERRIGDLQTGNPDELLLRHVIPGNRNAENQLHRRFEPARIRGEWFGREYLPVILAFAAGIADEMLHAYDGTGHPPTLNGGRVHGAAELERLRRDIERLVLRGHTREDVAGLTLLDLDELDHQLTYMRRSTLYFARPFRWQGFGSVGEPEPGRPTAKIRRVKRARGTRRRGGMA